MKEHVVRNTFLPREKKVLAAKLQSIRVNIFPNLLRHLKPTQTYAVLVVNEVKKLSRKFCSCLDPIFEAMRWNSLGGWTCAESKNITEFNLEYLIYHQLKLLLLLWKMLCGNFGDGYDKVNYAGLGVDVICHHIVLSSIDTTNTFRRSANLRLQRKTWKILCGNFNDGKGKPSYAGLGFDVICQQIILSLRTAPMNRSAP